MWHWHLKRRPQAPEGQLLICISNILICCNTKLGFCYVQLTRHFRLQLKAHISHRALKKGVRRKIDHKEKTKNREFKYKLPSHHVFISYDLGNHGSWKSLERCHRIHKLKVNRGSISCSVPLMLPLPAAVRESDSFCLTARSLYTTTCFKGIISWEELCNNYAN